MTPSEFKKRFLRTLPEAPSSLQAALSEFVEFDKGVLNEVRLSKSDKEFLTLAGLPRDAAPFLSFYAWDQAEQARRIERTPEEADLLALGHNGYGDTIAIDLHSGEVVYFNHDRGMERVFVNSSVVELAESLCIFAEHLNSKQMEDCLEAIESVDKVVGDKGGFWAEEVGNEIAAGG